MRLGALVVLATACGSTPPAKSAPPPPSIRLHGSAAWADGSPAAEVAVQFSLLASGTGLFPTGSRGCSPGDEDAQALLNVFLKTSPQGTFAFDAPVTGFVRATDKACSMPAEAAARVSSIDVRGQASADFSSCLPYCRQHPSETCYSDCAGHGRKFVWADSLSGAILDVNEGVRFQELGPPLPGVPASDPPLPDLQVDGAAAQSSAHVTQDDFTSDSCEVQEGCVSGPGTRALLRFDGSIENLGSGDLRIGSPVDNPLFTYSACHKHYHLEDIMNYELVDQTGAPVLGDNGKVVGRKQGFCIVGITRVAGRVQEDPYDCTNQGLSRGWEDVYESGVTCQWLDVTGVPAGDYSLRITVNPLRTFPESNFDNNSAIVPVSIP